MTISQRLVRGVAIMLAAVVAGVFAPTMAHAAGATVTRNALSVPYVYNFTVAASPGFRIEFDLPEGINVLPWTSMTWARSGSHWTGTGRYVTESGGYFGTGGSSDGSRHQLLNCVLNGNPCTIIIGS